MTAFEVLSVFGATLGFTFLVIVPFVVKVVSRIAALEHWRHSHSNACTAREESREKRLDKLEVEMEGSKSYMDGRIDAFIGELRAVRADLARIEGYIRGVQSREETT